ncbi:MAG: YciI family protein [bacterium]|nr:YciI family protein [bacterium]
MLPRSIACRSLLGLLGLAACAAPNPEAASREGVTDATLVILRTGDVDSSALSPEQRREHFAGHFANMGRLAQAGDLLLAGPYGRQKSAADLRGIFVLATTDRERAQQLAETDPCFRAGIFRFEYHDFSTTYPMHECVAADLERQAAAKRAGKQLPPGAGGRGYVMVTITDGSCGDALAAHDAAVLDARIGEGRLVLLACDDLTAGRAVLAPFAAELGDHTVDEWFGTDMLVAMSSASR